MSSAPTAGLGPEAAAFRELLVRWPASLARRGVLMTTLNETITFKGFMLKQDMVVFERQNPDTMGARFVMTPYSGIAAVKMIDPLKADAFAAMGFEGRLSD